MKRKTTVIFDLDGTLLDTLNDLAKSVNYALSLHKLPQRSFSEIRSFLGNGIHHLIKLSVPEELDERSFEKVFATFKAYYVEHSMDETIPFTGIIDLLKYLKEKDYKIAIVSNKLDVAVQDLNNSFFSSYIQVAIGENVGVRRKPAPDMILKALRELKSEPADSVYVGDSEVDIETSRNAEIDCICVSWGFRDKAFLEKNGAKVVLDTPQEMEEYLKLF